MSRSAWIMMLVTWTVITYFAIRFFWLVYRKRNEADPFEEDDRS